MEPITNLCILFAVIIIVILVFCNKTIARIKKEQIAKAKKIEEKNLRNWHLFLSSLEAHEKEKIHQLITKKNKDFIKAQQIFETRNFEAVEDINWAHRKFKEANLWEFLSQFEEIKPKGEA